MLLPSLVEIVIVYGNILGLELETHHVHVEFSKVHQRGTLVSNLAEVLLGLFPITLIDTSALNNQQQLVKLVEDLAGWLVDSRYHTPTLIG